MKVTQDRWRRAQAWELANWERVELPARRLTRSLLFRLGVRRYVGNDWNNWWYDQFDAYRSVPAEIANAIELGCGPYTNIRLIAQGRKLDHVFCNDPLIRHYIQFRGRWLSEAFHRGQLLIDDHPLEECPFGTDYFDLTVMINVLDHVQDGRLCLDQAVRITRPGGLLVLGQDLTDAEDLQIPSVRDDLGHPIKLTHPELDGALLPAFTPVIHRVLPRNEGRNPAAHYGTYVFIGRKTGDPQHR